MITFYIANSIDDAEFSTDYMNFDETMHLKLSENQNDFPFDVKALAELSPFGEAYIFGTDGVYELSDICENIVQFTWAKDIELNTFSLKLFNFFNKAIEQNMPIIAIGD